MSDSSTERHDAVREIVRHALGAIAPEADLNDLDGGADIRDTLDLDSMDFLRFVELVANECRIDVPERDYRAMSTLDSCVAYLRSRDGRS